MNEVHTILQIANVYLIRYGSVKMIQHVSSENRNVGYF